MSADVLVELGRRSASIFGPGRIIVPALKAAMVPRQWDSRRLCWIVPLTRLDDALAAIEYRSGGVVKIVDQVVNG
jgi:hypothetical protein